MHHRHPVDPPHPWYRTRPMRMALHLLAGLLLGTILSVAWHGLVIL